MLRRMGVRGRLLLAFLGISAFAVIAAAAAMYSFSEVGGVLGRITEERVPAALDSLELSRQAERIVAAAPKLLAATTADEQAAVSGEIAGEVARLRQLQQAIEGRVDQASLVALREDIVQMVVNLSGLDAAIPDRLKLAEEREVMMRRVLNTARTARRVSEPGQALIESKLVEWRRAAEGGVDRGRRADRDAGLHAAAAAGGAGGRELGRGDAADRGRRRPAPTRCAGNTD
jgi:adenylate cyclase